MSPIVHVNQVSEPGASSDKSGIAGKFDIEATALPQLHQLMLTAQSYALGALNAAQHSLVTSQKNQKTFSRL